jgi:M6 family metalloprotease-like protein
MKKSIAAFLVAILALLFTSELSHSIPLQQSVLSGWLHLIWRDVRGTTLSGNDILYILMTDQGELIEIQLDELQIQTSTNILALNKKHVRLGGRWANASAAKAKFIAESLQVEDGNLQAMQLSASASAVIGSKRWVNVLCRFADSTGVTPKPLSYFDGIMGTAYPGLDHYWREVSFNNVNLTGTATVGWYNLPHNRSYYIYDSNGDGSVEADLDRLMDDATAVADEDVYFPDFSGINLMFNQSLDAYSYGGSWTLSLDGKTGQYSVTWLPPWGYQNQCVLAHEMGHGFGLPHSSGSYGDPYDSPWDVMSDNWGSSLDDPQYGSLGVHTISYHKDMLGWISSESKLTVTSGMRRTVVLDRLALPASDTHILMAKIPIGGSANRFYTVESRRYVGYDSGLPGEAVIIHDVDTTRNRPAQVVDADSDGDPGDDGAMWMPGEKFIDASNNISVAVNAAGSGGFTVTINSNALEKPAFDDFNGDGLSDLSVLRPSAGTWFMLSSGSPGSYTSEQWGSSSDKPVAADYDGDGKTDIAVWRPNSGMWYILPSHAPGTFTSTQWGAHLDHPLPGDYDGDGFVDIAVWRPDMGVWYILPTNSPGSFTDTKWGILTDTAVPGDYDGDGKTDIAVWRPSSGVWYILPSNSAGNYTATQWGSSGDTTVPADYDGDGKADMAVWRPGSGIWYVLPSTDPGSFLSTQWGSPMDIPVPGDYDGDGKSDMAVWRPSTGIWYILPSNSPGTYIATQWGTETDIPISPITTIIRAD